MRIPILSILLFTLIFTSCTEQTDSIKVGVFDENGDSPWCIVDAVEACKIDPEIEVRVVSAADIMSGEIDDFDVFLFPGGSGNAETSSLGEKGIQRIKDMVIKEGKGVVGICAGAYILSNTPDYTCLALSGAQAIDIEHDHRGNGLSKFTLSKKGKLIFPELTNQDTLYCQYYEGPVLIPSQDTTYNYTSLATMESDVHIIDGTPSNMTNNKPFITITESGKGRVASFVGHPECTPGMRWMVPRLIRWTIKKELISYQESIVKPELYTKEILYTEAQEELMNKYRSNLKGSKEEIIEAIDELIKMSPWSLKKWIPGLLRHNEVEVRIAAASALERLERTDAIKDIESAIHLEDHIKDRASLERHLVGLKKIINR